MSIPTIMSYLFFCQNCHLSVFKYHRSSAPETKHQGKNPAQGIRAICLIGLLAGSFLTVSSQDLSQISSAKAFDISGRVNATFNFYSASGIENRMDPFSYVLTGSVNPQVYGIQLPFAFTYSDRSLDYAQPFNRFGISPEYKWIRMHFGYRNINFSSYTLAGHSFLGAGAELKPGILRLGAVYGRFVKKTVPNTANPLDTLASPSRKGYSLKFGLGTEKGFFDLIFLRIRDDSSSLEPAFLKMASSPQANNVAGFNTKISFSQQLILEAEGALSIFTRDIGAADVGLSDNTTISKWAGLLNLNQSSEYATALRASLQYSVKKFNTGIQYRRIDPGYQSFGAYYFNTDLENITLNAGFRALRNTLSFKGNIGFQRDNLKQQKAAESSRLISQVNIGYNSGKTFSINGVFSNYSINQEAGRLPLNDTIRLYQTTRNLTLTPQLLFRTDKVQQMFMLNLSFMDLQDKNPVTAEWTDVASNMAMLMYFRNYLQLNLGLNAGLSYTEMSTYLQDRNMYGLQLGASKSFYQNTLSVGASTSFQRSSVGETKGWVISDQLTCTWKPHKKHHLKLTVSHISNSYPDSDLINSYSEIRSIISYSYVL